MWFVFIYYKHSVPWGQFNIFRHLKMHKSAGKPKWVLPYISPYLSSITCGCVQTQPQMQLVGLLSRSWAAKQCKALRRNIIYVVHPADTFHDVTWTSKTVQQNETLVRGQGHSKKVNAWPSLYIKEGSCDISYQIIKSYNYYNYLQLGVY